MRAATRQGIKLAAAMLRAAVWVLGTPAPWSVAGAVALEMRTVSL